MRDITLLHSKNWSLCYTLNSAVSYTRPFWSNALHAHAHTYTQNTHTYTHTDKHAHMHVHIHAKQHAQQGVAGRPKAMAVMQGFSSLLPKPCKAQVLLRRRR